MDRAAMKSILDSGRSVFWNGRLITTEAELPSVAELAKGDPAKEEVAAVDLQAQITALQQQLAELVAGKSTSDTLADDFPFAVELRAAGYTTRGAVVAATDAELDAVSGIGPASVEKIRAAQ